MPPLLLACAAAALGRHCGPRRAHRDPGSCVAAACLVGPAQLALYGLAAALAARTVSPGRPGAPLAARRTELRGLALAAAVPRQLPGGGTAWIVPADRIAAHCTGLAAPGRSSAPGCWNCSPPPSRKPCWPTRWPTSAWATRGPAARRGDRSQLPVAAPGPGCRLDPAAPRPGSRRRRRGRRRGRHRAAAVRPGQGRPRRSRLPAARPGKPGAGVCRARRPALPGTPPAAPARSRRPRRAHPAPARALLTFALAWAACQALHASSQWTALIPCLAAFGYLGWRPTWRAWPGAAAPRADGEERPVPPVHLEPQQTLKADPGRATYDSPAPGKPGPGHFEVEVLVTTARDRPRPKPSGRRDTSTSVPGARQPQDHCRVSQPVRPAQVAVAPCGVWRPGRAISQGRLDCGRVSDYAGMLRSGQSARNGAARVESAPTGGVHARRSTVRARLRRRCKERRFAHSGVLCWQASLARAGQLADHPAPAGDGHQQRLGRAPYLGPAPAEKRRSVATSRTPRVRQSPPMSGAIKAVRSAGSSRSGGTGAAVPSARRMSWWWMSASASRPGRPAPRAAPGAAGDLPAAPAAAPGCGRRIGPARRR